MKFWNTYSCRDHCHGSRHCWLRKTSCHSETSGSFLMLDVCHCCGIVWHKQDRVILQQGVSTPQGDTEITQSPRTLIFNDQVSYTDMVPKTPSSPNGWHRSWESFEIWDERISRIPVPSSKWQPGLQFLIDRLFHLSQQQQNIAL